MTSAELQEHASHKDCWLAIHGKVYDITNYLVDHPGGDDVMLEHAGMLVTCVVNSSVPASDWLHNCCWTSTSHVDRLIP